MRGRAGTISTCVSSVVSSSIQSGLDGGNRVTEEEEDLLDGTSDDFDVYCCLGFCFDRQRHRRGLDPPTPGGQGLASKEGVKHSMDVGVR